MIAIKKGIHPCEYKEITEKYQIKEVNAKKLCVFPMQQHSGSIANPIVKVNDHVLMGQIIGEASSEISANIISSISGTVVAIENRMTISGNMVNSIVIENDFKDEKVKNYGQKRDYTSLSNEEILNIIKDNGIVGLGGACFPTHKKLQSKNPDNIDSLIINACECEPYLTTDHRAMLEYHNSLITGILIVLKLFSKAKAFIGIEDNKKDVIKILDEKLVNNDKIQVVPLKTKYPQGAKSQIIYSVTNRPTSSKTSSQAVGIMLINAQTVIAIYNAVCENIPLIRRVVTFTGDCLKNPQNVSVPIGMSYKEVIEEIGGFVNEPNELVCGGPMMGNCIYSLDIPITKNASGLIAFKTNPLEKMKETNCINCGKCVDVCPHNLIPTFLFKASKKNDINKFIKLYGMECMSCGCCSYICPAKKPLTEYFDMMKIKCKEYLKKEHEKNGK